MHRSRFLLLALLGMALWIAPTLVPIRAQDTKSPKTEDKSAKTEADRKPDVIYWPTPQNVVDKMLELAEVKKGDVVYDLKDSLENVKKNKVEDLVTIKKADIFTLDLKDASVVTLYLLPNLNVQLMPQLEKLKPGSRIVSHDFDMKGAKPKKVVNIKAKNHMGIEGEHKIYLWVVPWEKE